MTSAQEQTDKAQMKNTSLPQDSSDPARPSVGQLGSGEVWLPRVLAGVLAQSWSE